MSPLPTRTVLAALAAACVVAACASQSPSTTTLASAAAPAANLRGSVGDTAAFPARLVAVGYGPARATYETVKPGYVTIISVDERRIEALMPLVDEGPRIFAAGSHTTGLNGNEAKRVIAGDGTGGDARLAEVQAYNRCIQNAARYDRSRQDASRKIVGRDSSGKPIYGPPDPAVVEGYSAEKQCRMPSAPTRETDLRPQQPQRPNRYLIMYFSDTPVEHKSILALAITETDPKLMAISIGRKLFDGRDALWSAHYRPW